jgi:hypothetical protein
MNPRARQLFLCFSLFFCLGLANLRAEDIDGVQPAAIDQPRVNLIVRRQPGGPPLMGKSMGQDIFNVEAFLDTGASGVMLSPNTASTLGVQREKSAGVGSTDGEARFKDVGIGGGSEFAISDPIYLSIAPMAPNVDVEQQDAIATTYTQSCGPLRAQIGPLESNLDLLTSLAMGDLDIAGAPVMQGKIVVMDAKDVNAFSDKIRTYLYDNSQRGDAAIPKTALHLKLSSVSFARFTQTTPSSSIGPMLSDNPLIGPNPMTRQNLNAPAVVVSHNGRHMTGSWLLDTGAAASMISEKQAAALGVTYIESTRGAETPKLSGVPEDKQFTLSVGGIGGQKKSAGFYLDELTLTTQEGKPLRYRHAPVLVADITVKDASGASFTLDGVFGMNFLVATANLTEASLVPDIDHLTQGPYRWIVYDQPRGILGLELNH